MKCTIHTQNTHNKHIHTQHTHTYTQHTHTHIHTLGRTPLDEGSARCRDLYLTTHKTDMRNIHASCGIRTHNPSKLAAADPRLRPPGPGIGFLSLLRFCKIHKWMSLPFLLMSRGHFPLPHPSAVFTVSEYIARNCPLSLWRYGFPVVFWLCKVQTVKQIQNNYFTNHNYVFRLFYRSHYQAVHRIVKSIIYSPFALLLLLLLTKRYSLYKVLACSTTFSQLSPFCAPFFQLPMICSLYLPILHLPNVV